MRRATRRPRPTRVHGRSLQLCLRDHRWRTSAKIRKILPRTPRVAIKHYPQQLHNRLNPSENKMKASPTRPWNSSPRPQSIRHRSPQGRLSRHSKLANWRASKNVRSKRPPQWQWALLRLQSQLYRRLSHSSYTLKPPQSRRHSISWSARRGPDPTLTVLMM